MIAFLLLAMGLLATWRFWQITSQILRGRLRNRGNSALAFLGSVFYIVFAVAMLGMWLTVVVTFGFMKSGAASGVPLGIALLAVPVTYVVCEVFLQLGFAEKSNQSDGSRLDD